MVLFPSRVNGKFHSASWASVWLSDAKPSAVVLKLFAIGKRKGSYRNKLTGNVCVQKFSAGALISVLHGSLSLGLVS
jgi:hypothetical protein